MPIKVVIIDDSAFIRQLLSEMLRSESDIEVVGTAADPLIAREKIKLLNPDVITLDLAMPRMNGLDFLERLMALRPTPVVVVSTLTQKGADVAVKALELGAVEVIAKPLLNVRDGLLDLHAELAAKIRAAAQTRPQAHSIAGTRGKLVASPNSSASGRIVAIGASTGGVEALQRLLCDLPPDAPPILVTQHMPAGFTASFAKRMNEVCRMSVSEATDRQRVLPGHVYIAKGNQHLELVRSDAHYVCSVHDGPLVSGHRPSVDVLFHSVADAAADRALGVILTGMGRDGAAGLLAMRRAGARTLGQSEASCLIYGMSKAARELDAVDAEISLERVADEILA